MPEDTSQEPPDGRPGSRPDGDAAELGDTAALRPPRGWAQGYDRAQVDAFLAELHRALRQDRPTMAPYEVADQRFSVVRGKAAYAMRPVDEYLDRAQELLRARRGPDDPLAAVEGREVPEVSHAARWVYAVAAVLVVAIVVVVLTLV
jgi:hypothetical protein